jgi:hypothetical protein
MDLLGVITDITEAIVQVDASGVPFRNFRVGVGPYGEPQLLRLISKRLNKTPKYNRAVLTRRTPDLLIPGRWAMEFKIARPFGDNGKEAENWSVNLLHPYPGNVSTIGDCHKLANLTGPERKAVVVIGYEHDPPRISLTPLFEAFELIMTRAPRIRLSKRVEIFRGGLVHPVHQVVRVLAWEVFASQHESAPTDCAASTAT